MDNTEVENASPIYDYLKQYIPEFDASGYSEDELINSDLHDLPAIVFNSDKLKDSNEVNEDIMR